MRTLAAAIVAMLLAAAGPAVAQDQKLIPLKVGTLKQASLTDVWVAKQAGIFEKDGLDVELIEFRNGNEAIAAQRGGHVDIVLSIPGTAMVAIERGFDLVLISQNETCQARGPDSGAIVVLKDSPINSLADLVGHRIALSGLHTQKTVAIQTVFRKAGIDPGKVQFIELPYASHPDALRSRQIEAVASLDPWTTQMRTSGLGKVLAWDYVDSVPLQPIGAWYATTAFVGKNREAVDRFARSIRDVIEYMHADAARAKQNVAAYTGLDVGLLKDMPSNNWDYRISTAKWQQVADMMTANGELQKSHKAAEYFSGVVKPYIAE
jgi:NitT/TauT family transport system substrate-binding protein